MDFIVIGSGFAGAVVARQMAENGHKVNVLEKRSHIGGNCYDEKDEYGVLVHRYGPHIFHTNIKEVYDYLSQFTEWYDYSHEVVANIYGDIIPVPFNLNSLKAVFGDRADALEKELIDTYGENARVPILELRKSDSEGIREIAEYVYENIFLKYTMKQWNQKPEEVDQSVTARVPVLISRDNRYFQDKYQGMPLYGYTPIFDKMLSHSNITVKTDTDAKEVISIDYENKTILCDGKKFDGRIIFTGAIDDFFDYKYGHLPYRSLRFDFEHYDTDDYQGHGVVNYTVSEDYTRITEFKHLTGQKTEGTTIIKEYPQKFTGSKTQVPYYAILSDENRRMHGKYSALAEEFGNIHLIGRLAEYKYYNIDGIVKAALDLSGQLLREIE